MPVPAAGEVTDSVAVGEVSHGPFLAAAGCFSAGRKLFLREIEVTRVLVAHKGLENSCVLCPAHVCHSELFEVMARRFGHLSKKDVAVSTLVQ